MDYTQALKLLDAAYVANVKRDREAELLVLAAFGNPQDKLKVIHVAGTNGKGSTCAMLSGVLAACGYSVGVFTSPHLERVNERITVGGVDITDDEFARLMTKIDETARACLPERAVGVYLSYFELLTVAAFIHFCEQNVDYAVVEVGLGGRLDCTNVIKRPLLSVITAIGLDHTHILGNSLPEIAGEKAGIIKKNCPVVLYSCSDAVYNVVADRAAFMQAPLYWVDQSGCVTVKRTELTGTVLSVKNNWFSYDDIELGLLGSYQAYNCVGVLMCVKALREAGTVIPKQAVYNGLKRVCWAGRTELLSLEPVVIIDGAHNIDGILAFCRDIEIYFGKNKAVVVAGFVKEKDWGIMARLLADVAAWLILTEPPNPRRMPVAEMKLDSEYNNVLLIENWTEAINKGIELSGDKYPLAVTGSLYLVGDARPFIKECFE